MRRRVERRYIQSRCITFAHYAYRYRISESVSVENDVLGLTLVDAKVLLDKIHSIHLDNFSIETRLKTVNDDGNNLGFGGGFGYRNNTR